VTKHRRTATTALAANYRKFDAGANIRAKVRVNA